MWRYKGVEKDQIQMMNKNELENIHNKRRTMFFFAFK